MAIPVIKLLFPLALAPMSTFSGFSSKSEIPSSSKESRFLMLIFSMNTLTVRVSL